MTVLVKINKIIIKIASNKLIIASIVALFVIKPRELYSISPLQACKLFARFDRFLAGLVHKNAHFDNQIQSDRRVGKRDLIDFLSTNCRLKLDYLNFSLLHVTDAFCQF